MILKGNTQQLPVLHRFITQQFLPKTKVKNVVLNFHFIDFFREPKNKRQEVVLLPWKQNTLYDRCS